MQNTVSVIIPVYNRPVFVVEAIESVLQQTMPAHEIIVVDDGSTDGTPQVLDAFTKSEKVRIIRQQNSGVAAARNTGAEAATGEFVAFLDSDDIWLPNKLQLQMQRFNQDPDLGLVHCSMEKFNENGEIVEREVDGKEGWVATDLLMLKTSVIIGPGSTTLMPKRIWKEVGGFDPQLPSAEDWDFSIKVAQRHRIGFVPEVLLRYRQHPVQRHRDIKRFEDALHMVYKRVFRQNDVALQAIRRQAYGNMHMILAGSYFTDGQMRPFIQNALKSIRYTPSKATYLMQFPLRRLRRILLRR